MHMTYTMWLSGHGVADLATALQQQQRQGETSNDEEAELEREEAAYAAQVSGRRESLL